MEGREIDSIFVEIVETSLVGTYPPDLRNTSDLSFLTVIAIFIIHAKNNSEDSGSSHLTHRVSLECYLRGIE